ncbi:putative mitochondrial carrier [Fasciolopsis buskii]|uniref:Putative mitochondrial carrier n=1 Tax=Fasciolopsis buskii TaxID=27845 RepID=A0A8E0RQ72_9TREM|nr:putative mitochondrial carrier [Fasciolopsis buski]
MAEVVQFAYDYAIPTVTSTLLHPLVYARTMMMLGYEPEPPVLRPVLYTLVNKNYRRLVYPNIFTYRKFGQFLFILIFFLPILPVLTVSHLREDVGLFRLFTTGLPASIVGAYIKSYSTERVMERFTGCAFKKTFYVTNQGIRVFLIETSKLTAARAIGVTVSYPFQVIMIRQMAEFLGSDGSYSNFLFAIPRMIKEEGILSLFNGLIPRLLGEIITVWMISCFVYVLNQYIFTENVDPSLKEHTPMIASVSQNNIIGSSVCSH